MSEKKRKNRGSVYRNAVQLVAVGAVTGIFAGAVVTLYNLFASSGEEISRDIYAYIRQNPVFIPLLFVVLALGAFLLSAAVRLVPMIKGSGIPQTEGATRGIIRFRWYREAVAMFAASLLSIFMGLSAGSEGPSVEIGGACGDGVACMLRRNEMVRRYQVTGGACTGLAVAFNAPLTGMAFAFEEAHKRFTPEVFICAFSSVIMGLLTRTAIYAMLGKTPANSFASYVFYEMPVSVYGFVFLSAIVCGLFGVAFYHSVFLSKRLFGKISAPKPWIRDWMKILVAVVLGGIFSFVAVDVMGGGHGLIEGLGTHGGAFEPSVSGLFGLPFVAALTVVLVMKFVITCVNMGAGVPCGAFIPMLAIGACIGALLSRGWIALGMDEKYADLLVMICMAAFFTTIVRAPITGIVMVCELTWSFSPLLPVVIGVSVGYFIGDISRTDGIYEKLLSLFEKENGIRERAQKEIFTISVKEGCIAEGRSVRDILWPAGAVVTEISRGGARILPDGDTVVHGGDILTVVCRTDRPEKVEEDLRDIAGDEKYKGKEPPEND